jgi:predicted transcriptional regulator
MAGGEEGLEHKTRKLIFNYVLSHPGSSFGIIRDFFDLNDSTLKYHLHFLERNNKITSKREGRNRCYFSTSKREFKFQTPIQNQTLNTTQKQILNIIDNNPGIIKKELLNKTQLNRKTLEYNLNKLIDHKIIWKVKNSTEIGYEHITKEKLRGEIYHQLLLKLLSDEIDEQTFIKIKRKLENIDIENIQV